MLHKKILSLLLTVLISVNAYAQQTPFNVVRNDGAATTIQGNNLGTSKLSTDLKGRLFIAGAAAEDAAFADGDTLFPAGFVRNEGPATLAGSNLDNSLASVNRTGAIYVTLSNLVSADNAATAQPVRLEDDAFGNANAVMVGGAVNNASAVAFNATQGDVTPVGVGPYGNVLVTSFYDATFAGAFSPIVKEDAVFLNQDAGVSILAAISGSPGATAADGDYGNIKQSLDGRLYVDPVLRSSPTATQPSVTTATSFTCVAANAARRMLTLQNNSAANILISLSGATLTGIVPTSSNIGLVLTAGSSYTCPPQWCTTTAVTCYQTSGGTINTISVIEG